MLQSNFWNNIKYDIVKNSNFLIGMSLLNRLDHICFFNGFFNLFSEFLFNILNINIISRFLGRISYFEIGIFSSKINSLFFYKNYNKNYPKFMHLCGIDLDNLRISLYNLTTFLVYQGSFHISKFFNCINLILPVNIFVEKYISYINLEGRFRLTQKVITSFKYIFVDWKIFQLFLIVKNYIYLYNFSFIYNFYKFFNYFKKVINYFCYFFFFLNQLKKFIYFFISRFFYNITSINFNIINLNFYFNKRILNNIFLKTIFNYYLTDEYCRVSKIMNICASRLFYSNFSNII